MPKANLDRCWSFFGRGWGPGDAEVPQELYDLLSEKGYIQDAPPGRGGHPQVRYMADSPAIEPNATPAAKEKAAELGVDLREVTGTGKDGRITAGDVEDAAEGS